jgi:hypothetical protein
LVRLAHQASRRVKRTPPITSSATVQARTGSRSPPKGDPEGAGTVLSAHDEDAKDADGDLTEEQPGEAPSRRVEVEAVADAAAAPVGGRDGGCEDADVDHCSASASAPSGAGEDGLMTTTPTTPVEAALAPETWAAGCEKRPGRALQIRPAAPVGVEEAPHGQVDDLDARCAGGGQRGRRTRDGGLR